MLNFNNWEVAQYSVIDPWSHKSKQNKEVLFEKRRFFATTPQKHVNSQFVESPKIKKVLFSKRGNRNWCREVRPESPTVKNSSCFRCLMVYNMVLTFVHYGSKKWFEKEAKWQSNVIFVHWTFAFEHYSIFKRQIVPLWKKPGDTVELFFLKNAKKNWLKCSSNHKNLQNSPLEIRKILRLKVA